MEHEPKNVSTAIAMALKAKGISPEKLAQVTGISENFIGYFLREEYDKLPAAPYVHGYLMEIADVLGLDGKKLWEEFTRENGAVRRSGGGDTLPRNRFAVKRFGKAVIVYAILAGILLVYGGARILLSGRPNLELFGLEDGMVVDDAELSFGGTINPRDRLTLNGEAVYVGKDGVFSKSVTLEPGFNTFVFTVTNIFGKEFTVTRQVFYREEAENVLTDKATSTIIEELP